MFKDSNFDRIAEETNRYARQAMETKPDPAWRETDAEEVKAFFALDILFGIKQLPVVYSYWSKNQLLGVPEVQKILPRNRFAKISLYLHLNDKRRELPRGHANREKLFKVRPILDSIVEAMKSEYRPSKNVSIDEAMIPFKGRLSLKQYMPLNQWRGELKCGNAQIRRTASFAIWRSTRENNAIVIPDKDSDTALSAILLDPWSAKITMFLLIIFSIPSLWQKICFEIEFISAEPFVEIDKAYRGKLPLRLKESSDFAKERRCSFAKGTLSSLYGRTRSQFIYWAPNLILWGTTLSVDGNAMERWFKFPAPQSWKHTTTTWAVLT